MTDLIDAMRATCKRHGADFLATPPDARVGVADNVGSGAFPVNGLRHRQGQTSGWFLWAGEESTVAPDVFKPSHAQHLVDRCPEVMPLLGLAPGWRFLIAPNREDVWFDPSLLDHEV